MEPLARVPADGDVDAREILDLARDGVTADLLGCMVGRDARVLSLYGACNLTVALRRRSALLLREALLAFAIAQAVHNASDDRDVMVALATYYFVAEQLGLVPAEVFSDVASSLPGGWACPAAVVAGVQARRGIAGLAWLSPVTARVPGSVVLRHAAGPSQSL
jgi:hypothetical protein